MIIQIQRMRIDSKDKNIYLVIFGSSDPDVRYRPKHPTTEDNKILCDKRSQAYTVLYTCELVFQCKFRHVATRKIGSDVEIMTYESTKPLLAETVVFWAKNNVD